MLLSLRDPVKIEKVQQASSPYVLRKIIAADPTVLRLISAGRKVLPLVEEEIAISEKLEDTTLAILAFIVESVDAESAPRILGNAFRSKLEDPGPFFVHFAAHAIRSGYRLPLKPAEMVYSTLELIETEKLVP
jgi:hypothetical protein